MSSASSEQTKWLSGDETRFWRAFLLVTSGLPAALDADLKGATNISHDDYEVLVHLSESDEHRVRMSDLSTRMLHSKSRVTQRVDRLVKRGWVTRERCDEDARGTWATLTPAGLGALEAAAPAHVAHVRERLLDHIEPDELATLAHVFERLANTLSRP